MRPAKMLSTVVTVSWLILVCVWSAGIFLQIWDDLPKAGAQSNRKSSDGASIVAFVKSASQAGLCCKDLLVNLNGGWTRLLGRRYCNKVYRLRGGKLFGDFPPILSDEDVSVRCDRIVGLRDAVERQGGRFLYIQPPYGIDLGKTMLPRGVPSDRINGDVNVDRILDKCSKQGVAVLDMRQSMAATPSEVLRSFYRTDHHWRIEAVFKAFPDVIDAIRKLGVIGENDKVWDESEWRYVNEGSAFVGSLGRRTGTLFSGWDDFGYYDTFIEGMSVAVPSENFYKAGTFSDVVICKKWLSTDANKNAVYLGENVALIVVRNPSAKYDKRLLILKDSFARPLIAFFSAIFREVHAIDPRHYKESVSQYIAGLKPDCVMMCYNPVSVSSRSGVWFDFGGRADVVDLSQGKKVAEALKVNVVGGKSNWAYKMLPVHLDANSWHRLSFKTKADPSVGAVTLRLYDGKAKKYPQTTIIPCEDSGTVHEWVFKTGASPMQLAFYAGVAGNTRSREVEYCDICVERLETISTKNLTPEKEDHKYPYTVKFYKCDGSGATREQSFNAGTAQSLLWMDSQLGWSRPGYEFIGWVPWNPDTKPCLCKYVNGQKVVDLALKSGETVNLWAAWKSKSSYRVCFNRNDGTGVKMNQVILRNKEDNLAWMDSMIGWKREGYVFKGWAESEKGAVKYANGAKVKNLAMDGGTKHLYAIWRVAD